MEAGQTLDLTKPGVIKALVKVKSVSEINPEKKAPVFIEIEGSARKLKAWPDQLTKYTVPVVSGAEAEAEIEVKERTNNTTGEIQIEAWLKSFGGAKKGGFAGAGRAFTPKSAEEIHSASVCGCVKSAFEYAGSLEMPPSEIRELIDIAIDGYLRGITRVTAGKSSAASTPQVKVETPSESAPVEQPVTAKKQPTPEMRMAVEYFESVNGSPEELKEIKRLAKEIERDWALLILDGEKANLDPTTMIREAQKEFDRRNSPSSMREELRARLDAAHPGIGASSEEPPTDFRLEFERIREELNWPTYSEAKEAYTTLFKRLFPGRRFRDTRDLTSHDYYSLFCWAESVANGSEEAPMGFIARAKEVPSHV